MIKIDLNVKLKGLDGNDIPGEIIGKNIANVLVSENKGDALKYYDWAVKLYKGEPINVDRADFDKIKAFINDSDRIAILLKAQALILLKEIDI